MNTPFNEMLQYNRYANHKLIQTYQDNLDKVSENTSRLLHHILNTFLISNYRIIEKEIEINPKLSLVKISNGGH